MPITSAPAKLASCTTHAPTPPEAAVTRIRLLFALLLWPMLLSPTWMKRACQAVWADNGSAADSAHVRRCGR